MSHTSEVLTDECAFESVYRMVVDAERLILYVSERPELWDRSCVDYKDTIKKRNSWTDICQHLTEGFENKQNAEKEIIEKSVIAKWKGIRDGYVKAKRKEQDHQKSGSSKKPIHKYIYSDMLNFLESCVLQRKTTESDSVINEEASVSINDTIIDKKEYSNKRKNGVEHELSNYINKATKLMESRKYNQDDDEDMAFFKSLLPTVKNLSSELKFQFRMDTMQNLNRLAHTPLSQHLNCNPLQINRLPENYQQYPHPYYPSQNAHGYAGPPIFTLNIPSSNFPSIQSQNYNISSNHNYVQPNTNYVQPTSPKTPPNILSDITASDTDDSL